MELTCANVAANCQQPGKFTCRGCLLVSYCGKDCQKSHWPEHKKDCKSPLSKESWKPSYHVEGRQPRYQIRSPPEVEAKFSTQKFFWGNIPAIDIVKLQQHEGLDMFHLKLLFAASGDLRNVMLSMKNLPEDFYGLCDVTINDHEEYVVSRNVIMLLVALHYDASTATVIILHLWYSVLVPTNIVAKLKQDILPLIEAVLQQNFDKSEGSTYDHHWTFGTRHLVCALRKETWEALPSFINGYPGMTAQEATLAYHEHTLSPLRKDHLERSLYDQPLGWRVPRMQFRKDGILLPFGASRAAFMGPNPMFFSRDKQWHQGDIADPMNGFSVDEVLKQSQMPTNDIYGALHSYVRDLIHGFCERIADMIVGFTIFPHHVEPLADIFHRTPADVHFDRIDLSNIVDDRWLGAERCLSLLAPFLRPKFQNPHAKIIGVYMRAVAEEMTLKEKIADTKPIMDKYPGYLAPLPPAHRHPWNATFLRFFATTDFYLNFEKYFERFLEKRKVEQAARAVGLRMAETNTLVEKWPMRLGANATKEEFTYLLATGQYSSFRFCEWEHE